MSKFPLLLSASLFLSGAVYAEEAEKVSDVVVTPSAPTKNEFVTVVFGAHAHDKKGSIFSFNFEGRKEYESIVIEAARKLGPPSSFLGRTICGKLDPVDCAAANPTKPGFRPRFFVLYEGPAEQADAVARKFFEICSAPLVVNQCLPSRTGAGYTEQALEHFPPGGKWAVVIGAKVLNQILGASMTICYNGPCDAKASLDEAFWSGLIPTMNYKDLNLQRQ